MLYFKNIHFKPDIAFKEKSDEILSIFLFGFGFAKLLKH